MNHIRTYILAALLTALPSCNKAVPESEAWPLSFGVSVSDGVLSESRGLPVDTPTEFAGKVSSFVVSVYKDGSSVTGAPTSASLQDGRYVPNVKWFWNSKYTLDVYAVAPAGAVTGYSVNDATKTASFSYSVLSGTAVTDLRDVMVALYTGKGDNGRADLEFFHPLAAVSFVSGAVSDVTLKSITVRNVYPAGNCSVTWGSDPVPSVVWDFTGKSANASFTYTPSSPVPLDGSGITIAGGENTFILPPQTLGASAELSMNVSITGVDKTVKCSLEGTTWKAGYNCKYTINVDSGLIYADVSFEPWSHDGVTLNPKN